jgi:hypothetical protein
MSDLERSIDAALHRAVLRPGLRVDHLGDERVVLDAASGVVHTVRGAAVKALDAIRAGRSPADVEPTAALVAAGIAAAPGLSRRDVLIAASFASALVVSATLPSAFAAASTGPALTITGDGGELQQFSVSDGSATYALYRLAHTASSGTAIERVFIIGPVSRRVQLILVGAGGSGGLPDITTTGSGYDAVHAGGGGGGEVVEIDLGTVPAGAEFAVSVAGVPDIAQSGASSHVRVGATVIVEARGGGAGGSEATAAAAGGSGGGGASPASYRTAGLAVEGSISTSASIVPSATRYLNAGGAGVDGAGGGGGGAATFGAVGAGTKGGDGGGGRSIEGFMLTYSSVDGAANDPGDYPRIVGGGGGGAGSAAGNSNRGAAAAETGGGGRGGLAYLDEEGEAGGFNGGTGTLGTGGGGGGGASIGNASANPGLGGSGVAWVRMRTN